MILLALAGLAGIALLLWFSRYADASISAVASDEGVYTMVKRLTGTFLPAAEDMMIFETAVARGVDARLLAAIRKAEMGGPGREFGILSIPAPTYYDQAAIAANTIRNNVIRYESDSGISATMGSRYTDAFIVYLGNKYAPIGADNDPGGLNRNWIGNVQNFYRSIDYA